jgi:hypothetical protein
MSFFSSKDSVKPKNEEGLMKTKEMVPLPQVMNDFLALPFPTEEEEGMSCCMAINGPEGWLFMGIKSPPGMLNKSALAQFMVQQAVDIRNTINDDE